MDDSCYMEKVFCLAERGKGLVSPNPLVGAVIVKERRVIAHGYHKRYGGKHAEIEAIEHAEESLKGSTLYCNLEPCCSYPGKNQPSCTARIIKEKFRRVVIANVDPNPMVSGRGIGELIENGIQVTTGVCREKGNILNEVFFKFMRNKTPFVHLKIAQSLDGKIATQTGRSRWITDRSARSLVHSMRAEYDAVLVGRRTVCQDDPRLNVRLVEGRDPIRVILDTRLSLPFTARLICNPHPEKTIVFTTHQANKWKREALEERGVQICLVSSDHDGLVDLKDVLLQLGNRNITSLLVEGGAEIFSSFIRQRLFDKISIFIAPILIGDGVDAIRGLHIDRIKEAVELINVNIKRIDAQLFIQGYPKEAACLQGS